MRECNSCGKCCTKYGGGGLSASEHDLALWESLKPDIHKYVRNKEIWMDPETGMQLEFCPWLRKEANQVKFSCAIYFDRPEDCRVYPANVEEMLKDDCEMLELRDLGDLKRAQFEFEVKFADD